MAVPVEAAVRKKVLRVVFISLLLDLVSLILPFGFAKVNGVLRAIANSMAYRSHLHSSYHSSLHSSNSIDLKKRLSSSHPRGNHHLSWRIFCHT
jgi:hypothetical protein